MEAEADSKIALVEVEGEVKEIDAEADLKCALFESQGNKGTCLDKQNYFQ